jgi:outer membrane protein OmpA-like peptidoglycan-associated protein
LLLLLIAVGFGAGGYEILRRMQALEEQVASLSAKTGEAAALSRQAAEQAAAAEAAAQRAAEGRQAAETQMAEARQDADASRVQADAARQQADSARETAARAQAEAEEIRKKAEAEIDRLHAALGNIAETRRSALGLVMNLGGDHLKFEFDKILMTSTDTTISVGGHTDDVGTDAYNQKLSERRAAAVRDYLIKAGLPAAILSVTGHGKSVPLVPGTSDAARAPGMNPATCRQAPRRPRALAYHVQ